MGPAETPHTWSSGAPRRRAAPSNRRMGEAPFCGRQPSNASPTSKARCV